MRICLKSLALRQFNGLFQQLVTFSYSGLEELAPNVSSVPFNFLKTSVAKQVTIVSLKRI